MKTRMKANHKTTAAPERRRPWAPIAGLAILGVGTLLAPTLRSRRRRRPLGP